MDRITTTLGFVLGLVFFVQSLATPASPSVELADTEREQYVERSILLVAERGDPRIGAVYDAVEYWNATLGRLGAPVRLGDVAVTLEPIPKGAGQRLKRGERPAGIGNAAQDFVIILSDDEVASFGDAAEGGKRLIVIGGNDFCPMTLPNVPRNVIAHELGHALGLGHNSDPTKLMCGQPGSCRPEIYQSPTATFFQLTSAEEEHLVQLYSGR